MSTDELRAVYREKSDALRELIDSGLDIPADVLACKARIVGWARREWRSAVRRERKNARAA